MPCWSAALSTYENCCEFSFGAFSAGPSQQRKSIFLCERLSDLVTAQEIDLFSDD